jgi:transmembrane sensor
MYTPPQTPPTGDSPSLKEAAAWRLYLTEISAETSDEFETWISNPENAAAWRQIAHIWDYLGDRAHDPALIVARRAALGDANRAIVRRSVPASRVRIAGALAAVLVLGAMGWGMLQLVQQPDDYRTVQGERRMVTLVDGSKISLDASSEVTVRYSKNARELHLLRGQARFDVSHDVERPFTVTAGNQKVIATGTAFNIDMAGPKVLVTLIEGHVVVVDENLSKIGPGAERPRWPAQVELKAGQQLAAVPTTAPEVDTADVQRTMAWTNGQIVFDNETISSLVVRVNRYADVQVVIVDPKIATMRISGVINAGDVSGFVDIVTHYLPVRASSTDSGLIALAGEAKKIPNPNE